MLESTLKYCKEKAIDLLAGFVPKTYSMAQECNILGLYDDTFIITKQENLVGIISLQGLSYSNLMQKDLEGYFDTRQNVLNTISKDIQLRIVAKRRKEFINQSPNIDNIYAKAIITQFESKEIYKTEYFLVFETITSNVKSFFEKKKLEMTTSINEELEESSKEDKQENENSSNETHSNTSSKKDKKNKFKKKITFSATSKRALLIQTIERVKNALKEFKLTLLNSKEVLNFYAEYINGKYIAFNPKLKRLSDSYIASNVHFKKDYFVIEFQNQNTFCACVGIKAYESEEISSLPISTLLHTQIELDLIFHIRSLGQFESLNFLKTKKKLTLSKIVKADIDNYIELVQANRLSMQECALNLVIRAKSKAKLDKSLKEILSLLNNAGLGSVTETIGLKPSYFSFFPNNANINPRMRHQTSQVIASLILFEKNNTGFRVVEVFENAYQFIIDLTYTKQMEEVLDEIVENKSSYVDFISNLNSKCPKIEKLERNDDEIKPSSEGQITYIENILRDLQLNLSEEFKNYKEDNRVAKAFLDRYIKEHEFFKKNNKKASSYNNDENRPATPKQISFAEMLAKKHNVKLPKGFKYSMKVCGDFINEYHKK
ncbi:FtsK/SpoIIIE domain-containing protein [Helicobacter pylori]